MKIGYILVIATAIIMVCSCGSGNHPARTKEEAEEQISSLLKECNSNMREQDYQQAISCLDEALELCKRFSVKQDQIYDITDRKEFALLKWGKFNDALQVAFEMDSMPEEFGNRKSPWNCLKIADCYMGMNDQENELKWMEKAVYERGFIKFKNFLREAYTPLEGNDRFQKMIRYMKDQIGLQHPAKDFVVNLTDGKQFKLSSQKGKVVLIDFWDVACAPCIKALPELKSIYSQYHNSGLEIIGISLDTDKKLLLDFLKQNDIPWETACSYEGWKDETAKLYGVNATPSTWLVDSNGILQYYNLTGDELKQAVEELINAM